MGLLLLTSWDIEKVNQAVIISFGLMLMFIFQDTYNYPDIHWVASVHYGPAHPLAVQLDQFETVNVGGGVPPDQGRIGFSD